MSEPTTCADVFADVARTAGETIAVRHNETTLTYRELAGRAGAVAELLRTRGVRPGDVVATVLDRSPRAVAAALGAWAVGAAYAHVDAAEPDDRVATLLAMTGADVVLTDTGNAHRVPVLAREVLDDTERPYRPVDSRRAGDVAYLVFTSGSTGAPKAVAVEHASLRNYVTALAKRIAPLPKSFGSTTTFASDLGNTSVFGALLTGGRLDIYDRETVLDPDAFAAELREHPVAALKCTPSQLEALGRVADLAKLLPTEVLLLGGEAFPPRLARELHVAAPRLRVFNHYGPSETTIGVLVHEVSTMDHMRQTVPIGRPLANVSVRLLDEHGEPVADGQAGQLYIGGAALARGYFGDDALTAAAFTNHGYATGDLVRRNGNGDYEFLGRRDRQVKIRGYRIEPAEVERALLSVPGVAAAFVAAESPADDQPLELVAYVVSTADQAELTRRLTDSLPLGHLPGRIHRVERIPTNANGKADLAALRELARGTSSLPEGNGPRTATERLIAGIWCEVLGRDAIDIDAKFGELGGDSFKSLAVFGRLRRHFPSVTIARLFAHPTVRALAAAIGDDEAPATEPATVVEL